MKDEFMPDIEKQANAKRMEASKRVSVPKIFYATEEGWETVQKLLADESGPSEATIAYLKKFKTPM